MLKSSLLAASVILASTALSHAQNAPMACDDDTFEMMDMQVDAMSASAMQDTKNAAAKEMGQVESAKGAKDMDGCMEHLQKAADIIKSSKM